MSRSQNSLARAILFVSFSASSLAQESKLKDVVNVRGVRSNALVGYGLVIGLAGTGDSGASIATKKAAANMFSRLGLASNRNEVVTGNMASVVITANLPPFARSGDKVDIRVSASGDAKSIAGGTLLRAELTAGDGQVYVVAQGPVVVGQIRNVGPSVATVARVPLGGTVEREFLPNLAHNGILTLSLKHPDFTTNERIVRAINTYFRGFYARSLDPASVAVSLPDDFVDDEVGFLSRMEGITIEVDRKAIVVMNERTGTIVLGGDITINPVTIAHGDLSVKVENPKDKKKTDTRTILDVGKPTIGGLVESLNSLGVKPADLIGILQAIHAAGALDGEIEFI